MCVFAGVAESQVYGRSLHIPRLLPLPLIALGVLFLGWVGQEYQRVEVGYRQLRYEGRSIVVPASQEKVVGSVLFDQLGAFLWFSRQKISRGVSEETVERMSAVAARYPYPGVIVNYVQALVYVGNYSEANRQLRVLRGTQQPEVYCQGLRHFVNMAGDEPAFLELVVVKFEPKLCRE